MFSEELKEKMLKKYKVSSIRTMEGQIRRVYRALGKEEEDFNPDYFVKQPEEVLKCIEGFEKVSVRKNIINTIVKLLLLAGYRDDELGGYTKIFDRVARENDRHNLYTRAKKDLVTMEEIVEKREHYNGLKDDPMSHLKYVILSLYSMLPPLRGGDYFTSDFLNEETNRETDNYYDHEKQQLVLNTHKNDKYTGGRVIEIPDELHEILMEWKDKNPTNYLIPVVSKGTRMSQQLFTDTLKRIFQPKNISVNQLRQSYVTYEVSKKTPEEAKNIADVMGHSITMQQTRYKKYIDYLGKIEKLENENKRLENENKRLRQYIMSLGHNPNTLKPKRKLRLKRKRTSLFPETDEKGGLFPETDEKGGLFS